MNHGVDAEKIWGKPSAILDAIGVHGMERYAASLPDFARAFQLTDRWLRCIDEGCPGGVHLAGSGILLGIDRALAIARAAGVTAVTSHEECGAAKLAAEQAGLDEAHAGEFGRSFAAELARRLGVSYCHLPISDMARPAGLHVARVVYYDGTGRFDPARCPELPAGFVISRRFLKPAEARRECAIAVGIALGPHGFGERFTAAEPMLLVAIGDATHAPCRLAMLHAELDSVAATHGGRVAVDGCIAPSVVIA